MWCCISTVVWQHSQPHTLPGAQHPGTISAIRLCSVRLAQPHWKARTALQSIQDRYLTHISGVKYATPSAMLLKIAKKFGGNGFLKFRMKQLLVLVGYFLRQLCLTVLVMLFCWAWCQRSFWLYSESTGQSILHHTGIIHITEMGAMVKALCQHFGLHCHSQGGPGYCAVAYHHFCSSDLVLISFQS